jgi:hypothetical protein
MFGSRSRRQAAAALTATVAERDAFLLQRDIALGERNELRRQLDEMTGERNEFRRQLDAALMTQAQGIRRSTREPEPSPSPQRSLFMASLPKSGTEFVGGAIRDATKLVSPMSHWDDAFSRAYLSGYCNREDVVSTGVFVSERLLLDTLRRLTRGYLHQSHCGATYHNLCVLRDAGFERATVLVRDPRDSTVSWTHHLCAMGPGMVNFNSLIQYLPLDYFRWPHEAQLAFQVRTFLPAAVNWIESWVGAAAAGEQPVQLQVALFDELRSDPIALVESILTFHRVEDYDLSTMQPPTPGERHFREGKSGSWNSAFSPADRNFADELIGQRLEGLFERVAA